MVDNNQMLWMGSLSSHASKLLTRTILHSGEEMWPTLELYALLPTPICSEYGHVYEIWHFLMLCALCCSSLHNWVQISWDYFLARKGRSRLVLWVQVPHCIQQLGYQLFRAVAKDAGDVRVKRCCSKMKAPYREV